MQRLTGVVMDANRKHVVVMTPTGEFKKVKVAGRVPCIGEEINIPVQSRRIFHMPKANWVAVAAAVILLLVAGPLLTLINQPPETAMAYVSIEVNPSIELAVGDRYHVLGAHAYNRDGERVLQGLDIKGTDYEEAVAVIKNRIEELGYFRKHADNTVVVSVAFVPGAKADKASVENVLIASANSVFADSNVKVATIRNVPVELRENAKKKGISFGKYAVLIEAVNSGLPLTEKNFREKAISDAISAAGGQPEEIISKASEEEQFAVKEKKFLAIMAVTSGLSNPTVASADEAAVSGKEAAPGIDSGNTKNKYVDSIRNSQGPEERRSGNKTAPIGVTSAPGVAGKPGEISSPDAADSSGAQAPNQAANGPGGSTGKTSPPTDDKQPVDAVDDKKTEDNYMANEDDGPVNNDENMMLLRPNF